MGDIPATTAHSSGTTDPPSHEPSPPSKRRSAMVWRQ
ncbi:hypothetical protein AA0117_g13242 [Alternaria alternata]|uniref:Uncharacterized protein n=1 Tax=Alternaria alternata TaxID=5599 RepID=A0A4Q4MSN1_ALTAL|nr:hypothetical protein AA0117_g13242 [Alternaria alternata]